MKFNVGDYIELVPECAALVMDVERQLVATADREV